MERALHCSLSRQLSTSASSKLPTEIHQNFCREKRNRVLYHNHCRENPPSCLRSSFPIRFGPPRDTGEVVMDLHSALRQDRIVTARPDFLITYYGFLNKSIKPCSKFSIRNYYLITVLAYTLRVNQP